MYIVWFQNTSFGPNLTAQARYYGRLLIEAYCIDFTMFFVHSWNEMDSISGQYNQLILVPVWLYCEIQY